MSLVYNRRKNGTVYVYEQKNASERKEGEQRRVLIGKLDPETGEIIPTYKKGDKEKERQAALPKPIIVEEFQGQYKLLQKAVDDLQLEPLLKKCFPRDYEKILTCAFYFISTGGRAFSHMATWQKIQANPCQDEILTSQRISELCERIDQNGINSFFHSWAAMNDQSDYYAMDVTSISTYAKHILQAQRGYNRDHEDLPQVNLLLFTGEKSLYPIYYRIYSGSISDVATLNETLAHMDLLDYNQMTFVFDRGFYSDANIEALIQDRKKFVSGVRIRKSLWVQELIEKHKDTITLSANHIKTETEDLYGVLAASKWHNHRVYTFLYFDPVKQARDMLKFDNEIDELERELLKNKPVKSHQKKYDTYFDVKKNRKKEIVKAERKEEAIRNNKERFSGWFALVSNTLKDPKEVLRVYREKDCVEKDFDDVKNGMNFNRLRVHSSKAMTGKVFIVFIALIIKSRLKQILRGVEEGRLRHATLAKVLEEMEPVHTFKGAGKQNKYLETMTASQKEIIKTFGLDLA